MHGLMMDFPLTLSHILDRAGRYYGYREVVSKLPEGTHRYTYGEFHVRVRKLMGALRSLGMEPGDRIATFGFNSYRHLELYFGIPCAGGVLHTLNIRLFADQLRYVVNHAKDRFIFVDRALVPQLEELASGFETVEGYVVMGGVPDGTTLTPAYDYDELLSAAEEAGPARLEERQAAALCYTSGTTGDPKGVLYDHRALVLHSFASCMADCLGVSERDTLLVVVPQFHANAWGLPFTAVMTGAKQVFPGPYMQAEHLADLIETESVTLAAGVPTLWIGLYHYLKEHPKDTSSVTRMLVGGSAMPQSLIEAYEKEFGIPVLHAWGMTETAPLGTVARLKSNAESLPEEHRYRLRAMQGMAPAGIEMRIVNDEGVHLPWDGEAVGEVEVRGPWVAGSYYNAPDGASRFTEDGWFKTGDVAAMDPSGFMRITDRTKDLIKSGGEWISSVELENAVMAHPGVRECAVVAVPDKQWTERPLAVVVPVEDAPELTLELLHDHLMDRVAKWWLPDHLKVVDEIPKTSVGKFDKKVLRTMVAEGSLDLRGDGPRSEVAQAS
ncbi:MAG: long-chain fatty acid--CoA ligase [Gemmatimonadetes bacterium]|nr:long-chain fatty acid--CoA ligase [Gemmatimonadota bacterium]